MKELEYPFDPEYVLKKKKSLKRALLESGSSFLEKKIAILGGSTTNDIKNLLEVFLLNYGIKPSFYESEYNQYYEDGMFPNAELEAFAPDVIYIHTSSRNISSFPDLSDDRETVQKKLDNTYNRFEQLWKRLADVYKCPIIQNNF